MNIHTRHVNHVMKVLFKGSVSTDVIFSYVMQLCYTVEMLYTRTYWKQKYILEPTLEFNRPMFTIIAELPLKSPRYHSNSQPTSWVGRGLMGAELRMLTLRH